jgi:putative redox protein
MHVKTVWSDKMKLASEVGGHSVAMDAQSPIGSDSAPTPKELVGMGLSGCTAMDVIALLKKYKEPLEGLEVDVEISQTQKVHPAVFAEIHMTYLFRGPMNQDKVLEAVRLSQTKYCGVSAMIAKTAPVQYKVYLNSELIGGGQSQFEQ